MKNVIILKQGPKVEAWKTLTLICKTKKISHNYLKKQTFPFKYRGVEFIKYELNKSDDISFQK
jgi:hypothetical protein